MRKISILMSALIMSATTGCTTSQTNNTTPSQDYYVEVVKELSSEKYYGRSNYNNGTIKAAEYILDQLQKADAQPIPQEAIDKAWEGKTRPQLQSLQPEFKSLITPCEARRWSHGTPLQLAYMQHYNFPLNAQRGAVELTVDGTTLQNTIDYTLKEFSPTFKGELEVVHLTDNAYMTPENFCNHLNSDQYANKAVVIDYDHFTKVMFTYPGIEVYKTYMVPLTKIGALICKTEGEILPYFKSRNHYNTPMPVFFVGSTFPADAKTVKIEVNAQMIDNDAHNILAYIPGTENTNKHYIIACHYDHLGICGPDNIFYGANDNASGTAMLLNLIRHFKQNPPKHSIIFAFFDAEENNLLGSFFYAQNPILPLEDILYFIELDMIGDNGNKIYCQISDNGGEGLQKLNQINTSMDDKFALLDCHPLDDYADHYPFALKGVPAIYMEVDGDTNKNYHSPRDTFENFSPRNYQRFFDLVTRFIGSYR